MASNSASSNNLKNSSRVKVVVRIRPLLPDEKECTDKQDNLVCLRLLKRGMSIENKEKLKSNGGKLPKSGTRIMLKSRSPIPLSIKTEEGSTSLGEELHFDFDKCYDGSTSQRELFNKEIASILGGVFEGINTTIFAYGATGTGKTFTMEGSNRNPGIVTRSIEKVFEIGSQKPGGFQIKCSFLEIYNDKVRDLLSKIPGKTDLPIRQGPNESIHVQGLIRKDISSVHDFNELYEKGCSNRQTGATSLNVVSSRSHSILMLHILSQNANDKSRVAKLHLIDLAGSEDNRKTGNSGERLTESGKINMSLFCLGKVINALNEGTSQRIPYRDSKLTRLLQDSLGGSSQSVMICNVSPTQKMYKETVQTLMYASKARNIVNNIKPEKKMKLQEPKCLKRTSAASSMEDKLSSWKEEKKSKIVTESSGRRSFENQNSKVCDIVRHQQPIKESKHEPHAQSQTNSKKEKLTSHEKKQDRAKSLQKNKNTQGLQNKENQATMNSLMNPENEPSEEDLILARDFIKQAIVEEQNENYDTALNLYKKASTIAPKIPKLQERVEELERRVQRSRKNNSMGSGKKGVMDELRSINEEMKKALEKELVHLLNEGPMVDILQLCGIGIKGASAIIEYREKIRFEKIENLKEIGFSDKKISKLCSDNYVKILGL